MRNSLLSGLVLAVAAGAAVPNKFTSGRPVVAQDVNDNFTYLDTTIAKKADASVKTDLDATKSDLKALQAKQKADSATIASSAANGLSMATVNSNIAGLRDTVGKKKDSAWIMKAVTPAAIGAIPASIGTANTLSKWTGASTLGTSGIVDDGTTISLSRKTSLNGLVAMTYSPGWNSLYGAVAGKAPLKENYGFSVQENNVETDLNSSDSTILQVGMKNILTATKAGVAVNVGDLSVAGLVNVGSYLHAGNWAGGYSNGWIGQASQYNSTSGASSGGVLFRPSGGVSIEAPAGDEVDINVNRSFRMRFFGDSIKAYKPIYGTLVGTVVASNILASNVADYVFEPSYKLSSLSEVEAYTKEHKHLPEVPSATEIERSGMDLAQMNLVLLKKVEELTLHAIEQQKAIEQQRQEMAQMKVELKAMQRN